MSEEEVRPLQKELIAVEGELVLYEIKYNMSSEQFYHLWKKASLPDTYEFNCWSMLYEGYMRLIDAINNNEVL